MMSEQENNPILVRKASGEREPFSISKLQLSLRNAGAEDDLVDLISNEIGQWIYHGVSTREIYSRAFSILRKNKMKASFRYKLKKSILQFGVTGYPFEHLVAQLLEKQGFRTSVSEFIEGRCVTHEVDVFAQKDKTQRFIECKYSSNQQKQISIQTPLYVQSRMIDIIQKRKEMKTFRNYSFSGWLVTNMRLSEDSLAYAKCAGLNVLSWNYPDGNGLKDMLDRAEIYPVTLLNYLRPDEKKHLVEKGIVVCEQILHNPKVLDALDLPAKKRASLMQELGVICGG
jgi:hypothetical protein